MEKLFKLDFAFVSQRIVGAARARGGGGSANTQILTRGGGKSFPFPLGGSSSGFNFVMLMGRTKQLCLM